MNDTAPCPPGYHAVFTRDCADPGAHVIMSYARDNPEYTAMKGCYVDPIIPHNFPIAGLVDLVADAVIRKLDARNNRRL